MKVISYPKTNIQKDNYYRKNIQKDKFSNKKYAER